jgi:hypothetical protein
MAISAYGGYHPIGPCGMVLLGSGGLRIQKADQPLIDDGLEYNLGSGEPADATDKLAGVPATASDQIRDSATAQLA